MLLATKTTEHKVWHELMDLVVHTYTITGSCEYEELYDLATYLRVCNASLPTRKQFGSRLHSLKEAIRFLYQAEESLEGLMFQLKLGVSQDLLSNEEYDGYHKRYIVLHKMIETRISNLQKMI